MPFGGVAPSGHVCVDGQGCVHADLVDLSEGGICVLITSPLALSPGDRLALTLHENFGVGTIQVGLELCWMLETPMGLRLGARFLDPGFSPSATFLQRYLETDFSHDHRPGS